MEVLRIKSTEKCKIPLVTNANENVIEFREFLFQSFVSSKGMLSVSAFSVRFSMLNIDCF